MNKQGEIEVYTDGSCHTQLLIGGWAAIIINNGETIISGSETDTTHNRMEILAVTEALNYVFHNFGHDSKVIIYSDSQYVVRIIDRMAKLRANNFLTKKGNPIRNKDLVMRLIDLIDSHNIRFVKVKAHQKKTSSRNYNIEVDKLARKIVREVVDRLK